MKEEYKTIIPDYIKVKAERFIAKEVEKWVKEMFNGEYEGRVKIEKIELIKKKKQNAKRNEKTIRRLVSSN